MALSPAKKASDARHIAKLDVIKIQPYKEEGAAIRAAAAASGKSVQAYILQAVRAWMEQENTIVSEDNTDNGSDTAKCVHIKPDEVTEE